TRRWPTPSAWSPRTRPPRWSNEGRDRSEPAGRGAAVLAGGREGTSPQHAGRLPARPGRLRGVPAGAGRRPRPGLRAARARLRRLPAGGGPEAVLDRPGHGGGAVPAPVLRRRGAHFV